jgi:hypothetical protein
MALPQRSKLSEFLVGDPQQSGIQSGFSDYCIFQLFGQKDNRPRICMVFL